MFSRRPVRMNKTVSVLATQLRDYAESFRDRNVNDDLLRYLVGTVYGMRGPLYASMAMGMLFTVAAWAMTAEPAIFLTLTLAHPIIGVARLLELRRFRRDCPSDSARLTTLAFDRTFTTS